VSYDDLLATFWTAHSPTHASFSRQYRSAVFYATDEQRMLAEESKESVESRLGVRLHTEIEPLGIFYRAEGYHQKYYLRAHRRLMSEFAAMYPVEDEFVDSTAAARVNGFVSGYGAQETLAAEIDLYGLSVAGRAELEQAACRLGGRFKCVT
jgi:peptide-methionine (S)-S-oxide reductase